MKHISRNTLLLAVGVLAIGAAIGAGGTYLALENNKSAPGGNSSSQTAEQAPPVSDPVEPDTSVPAGTVSPTEAVNDPKKFTGKEITLHGMLVKFPDGKYLLAGKETQGQNKSVDITFPGQEVDDFVSTFAGGSTSTQEPKGTFTPVSAKGKLSEDKGKLSFIAVSVTK